MGNSCNALNVRPIKISELANYASLKSNDIILITEKDGSNLYSRKTTFGDFVNSITQLTSSLSGNVNGKFTGSMNGTLNGNLTGSVYGGTLKGTFIGQGSITGIPFTSLNGQSISFKGTGSYSVSSSYSIISTNSKTSTSSSYSLTSSYGKTNFAVNSKSSSLSQTSSLSQLSKLSLSSLQSDRSNISNVSHYAYDGRYVESSSLSNYSNFNLSSSYSLTSSYAKSGSYSKFSTTSSYALKSENRNVVKSFMTITGPDASQFVPSTKYSVLSYTSLNGYNIKSIKYAGRSRIWGTSEDKTKSRWWPTFYVEFQEPLKYTNYIVQGTIWEIDEFSGDETVGNDCEIGTFQIPFFQSGSELKYSKSRTGFTMSWQGGLKCNDNQQWMASFQVMGGDVAWTPDSNECKCE